MTLRRGRMCTCWRAWTKKRTSPTPISRWATIPWSGPMSTSKPEIFIFLWAIARNTSTIHRSPSSLKTPFSGPPARRVAENDTSHCFGETTSQVLAEQRDPRVFCDHSIGVCLECANSRTRARFQVLAFYSTDVESDHVKTANDALDFYRGLAAKNNFVFDATTDWGKLNDKDLKLYNLILWLNEFPKNAEQRAAFEKYMEHGGGWIGFHVAGYN